MLKCRIYIGAKSTRNRETSNGNDFDDVVCRIYLHGDNESATDGLLLRLHVYYVNVFARRRRYCRVGNVYGFCPLNEIYGALRDGKQQDFRVRNEIGR